MKNLPDRIPPENRPDFGSYTKATWRDISGGENVRYRVRPMQDGSGGFEVIDTHNNADAVVQGNFKTARGAEEWMRVNRAP